MDVRELLKELGRSADAAALPALYAAVSVPPEKVRAWLRARSLPFLDPAAAPPRLDEVDRTADHVIAQSQATTAAIGAFGGLAGWLSVPPEVLAWIVACLRLAQRLAIVYGFDPRTDRGHAALSRAVAAGFEAELPERGLVELRLSDVARAMVAKAPPVEVARVGQRLARAVVVRSVVLAAGRVARLLPVVSSAAGASGNHAETARVGARMKTVLRSLAEAPPAAGAELVEAVEVVPRRRPL